MFKKILTVAFLPIVGFLTFSNIGLEKTSIDKKSIASNNEVITLDSANNDVDISYEESNKLNSSYIYADVNEDVEETYIWINDLSVDFVLNDGHTLEQFNDAAKPFYLTLYDVNNGVYQPMGTKMLSSIYYSAEYKDATKGIVNLKIAKGAPPIIFSSESLEEYHDYIIGFNFKENDDFVLYSNSINLDVPEISFDITSTSNSIEVGYEFTSNNPSISYEYKNPILILDAHLYEAETENNGQSGTFVINDLNSEIDYSLWLRWDITKTIGTRVVDFKFSEELIVATLPEEVVTGWSLLSKIGLTILILLLIFLIILILIIALRKRNKETSTEIAAIDNSQDVNNYVNYNNTTNNRQVEVHQDEKVNANNRATIDKYFDEEYLDEEISLDDLIYDEIEEEMNDNPNIKNNQTHKIKPDYFEQGVELDDDEYI